MCKCMKDWMLHFEGSLRPFCNIANSRGDRKLIFLVFKIIKWDRNSSSYFKSNARNLNWQDHRCEL